VRRLLAAYREEGATALAHGNRGNKPHNALAKSLRRQVSELAESTYAGCNNQHPKGVTFSLDSNIATTLFTSYREKSIIL